MRLEGGHGTKQAVTNDGRALVHSVGRTERMDAILRGMGFTIVHGTVTPTGPDDCFLFIDNDDEAARPLVIESLEFESAAAEDVYLQVGPTYTLATTHAAVDAAQNRRAGHSSVFADFGTAEAGADITGLVSGVEIARFETGAGTKHEYNEDNAPVFPIILGKGQALSVFAGTGTAAFAHLTAQTYWLATPDVDG